MDVFYIILEILLQALAAAYQETCFIILDIFAGSYYFQHQCFQAIPEVINNLVDILVQGRLRKVALHALQHPDDILLTQVVGKLGLEVEPAKTWHKRIILHYCLWLLAVHRITARHVESANLIYLGVYLSGTIVKELDCPLILLPLAKNCFCTFRQVRSIHAKGFQSFGCKRVATARLTRIVPLLLAWRQLHLGRIILLFSLILPGHPGILFNAIQLFVCIFGYRLEYCLKALFPNCLIIYIELTVQEPHPVTIMVKHAVLYYSDDRHHINLMLFGFLCHFLHLTELCQFFLVGLLAFRGRLLKFSDSRLSGHARVALRIKFSLYSAYFFSRFLADIFNF